MLSGAAVRSRALPTPRPRWSGSTTRPTSAEPLSSAAPRAEPPCSASQPPSTVALTVDRCRQPEDEPDQPVGGGQVYVSTTANRQPTEAWTRPGEHRGRTSARTFRSARQVGPQADPQDPVRRDRRGARRAGALRRPGWTAAQREITDLERLPPLRL